MFIDIVYMSEEALATQNYRYFLFVNTMGEDWWGGWLSEGYVDEGRAMLDMHSNGGLVKFVKSF